MVLTRLVDSVSRGLAFFPPPPSYTVERHGDGARELYLEPARPGVRRVPRALAFFADLPAPRGAPAGGDHRVVAALLRAPGPPTRLTLLHAHGNATDLGEVLPLLDELSRLLRCNVVGYDYPGYGRSCPGEPPAASRCLAAAAAVLAAARARLGCAPRDWVLYGNSLGGGPTCWLAHAESAAGRPPAGVVLHAAFTSGVRVLKPGWTRWPGALDLFPNHRLVGGIAAPVLVLHGTADEVVHVSHGRALHAAAAAPFAPLWAEGHAHNDVEAHPEYVPTLRRFLAHAWGDEYTRRR